MELPPPQEQISNSSVNDKPWSALTLGRLFDLTGSRNRPSTAAVHTHPKREGKTGDRAAEVREVVLTVTSKVEAVAALTVSLAGTEQSAPVGAPLQVSVAVPLIPCPPMVSV